ncbi:FAD-binding protein [Allosaccharopolyspora coralli]|uniref:FAD-binding protein n=1 Tax=Allosaccharopolyspora coralli TaxID=2665642 RepID=A0A5Q3QAI7_9PSEU|nr:FAD-binding protein [Allosaccharopolyspora coralli]QGK70376.1 FAD-binding protein [Allosaccharopolyspora coralli]
MVSELHADVVVVGFGAAGACAAIEAARAGAEVVLVDRFTGGGATRLSGGVVYAGGGTSVQRAAGVDDSTEAMRAYLAEEVGDAVSAETLTRFCADSPAMIGWLSELGVPFESSLCPYKTSYPSNRHYLYYSGSESAGGFRDAARPAPRGHRVRGRGTSGSVLFEVLERAVEAHGVRVLRQTRVRDLVQNADGTVTGIECDTLLDAPARVRSGHARLSKLAAKPGLYVPKLSRALHARVEKLESRHATPVRLHARRGVVLASGGFVANREMMREHAPDYRGGLPLGTRGDDGTSIRLGQRAGAAVAHLDRVSAWRFITPPSALLGGLLVDEHGHRICDESRYGAALGQAMIERNGGKGWLLVDAELRKRARRQIGSQTVWFQRLQALYLLGRGRVSAPTVRGVAARAGIAPDGLQATVDAATTAARSGAPDETGKPVEFAQPPATGPFSLIDISIKPSQVYPCPMLTLGGLAVDEETGRVSGDDGAPVPGLYAAGRSAVGICSRSYVSGLSLADCVFSGRRSGAHAAADGAGDEGTGRRSRAHK